MGAVIERYRYDAFGAPTIYTATCGTRSNTVYDNRFLFTGREYAATYRGIYITPAFNFYEYRARAYNPQLGRFMSEDPKGFSAGDYNLFRYCHNDPVDSVDPLGLEQNWNGVFPPVSHVGQAIELGKEIAKQIAQLQAHVHNMEYPGHGAIGIGMANHQIGQLQQALGQITFRAEVQRAIEGGGRLAQLGNAVQSRTIVRSGNLRVDTDGSGPDHGDPTHANETTYQPNGRSLNADTDPYVAIPTSLLRQGVRLGDRALLSVNGRSAPGVVGDTGATPRLVEASLRLVHDVGVRTQDVHRIGPVPATPGEVPATMTLYPSGN
jgi:RHS repeat-associated protein